MLLGSKAPSNGVKAQELLETESILRQAARSCRTAEKWAGICQPISADSLRQLTAFGTSGVLFRTGCILTRSVFLTRRRTAIFRCRIRRPHIVVRLTSPIIRGILVRHRAAHIMPIVLWTIHVMRWSLRTRHSTIHGAIIRVTVDGTVIHATVSYWPRRDHIVSAEFSGPRGGCDGRTAMVHRSQKFAVTARSILVLDLIMRSSKVALVHESFFIMRWPPLNSARATVESNASSVFDHGAVINVNVGDGHIAYRAVVEKVTASPFAAEEADSDVAEAVIHSAVETNMRSPITGMPEIGAAIPSPITRGP